MMDNTAANKNHMPCQSWVAQNGWSTASVQGSLFSPLHSSQHTQLGSSSTQKASFDHLQASNPSCMNDISTSSSRHHPTLFKPSQRDSNAASTSLFANTATPSVSFAWQNFHTPSVHLNTNQGNKMQSQFPLGQFPCRPQHPPLLSDHDPFKSSCQATASQSASEGVNVEFAGVSGCPQRNASASTQEQSQWISSSQYGGVTNKCDADNSSSKKMPPRKWTKKNSPPASSEKTRGALLEQRKKLLQQLADLDKCLESVSPDDSNKVPSPNTADQSPSHDSASCLSPESADEQSDTGEAPGSDSEAESVNEEENSGVADPDPQSNSDDLSDFVSDTDWSSTDESISSCFSISSEKTSSLPKKKKMKVRSSKQKKSFDTVVLPSSNGSCRVFDRRNYCLFCSKPVSKMARHLEQLHSDKKEVAAAFQFPKNSRDRLKIWIALIKQGNFAHNKKVLKTGKGQLAATKRPNSARCALDFVHCLYCRGLYIKKAIFKHMKSCPDRVKDADELQIGRKRIVSLCVLDASEDLNITEGLKNILSYMTYNEVTQTIIDDKVILQFGESLYKHYGSNTKKHEYIRQNLRQIGRLVLEARKITPLKKLEDFFLPSTFKHVVSAVNVLAGYDAANRRYNIPSLAIKLGYNLQKICGIVEDNAIQNGNKSLAESAQSFLSAYKKRWNKCVSSGALLTLRETKKNTDKMVPFAQDVKLLLFHMEEVHLVAEKNLRDSPSAEHYAALVKVILARTIIFNRTRTTEVSSITLNAFSLRKISYSDSDEDIAMSDLERNMCRFFTRIDIRAKCGRVVPVLLKPSFVSAMELFVEARGACGVPSENPFLFGRPQCLTSFSGSDAVHSYVKECAAKNPEALTSAKIRKHYATMLQLISLDDNEADRILGPNNIVRALRQDGDMQLDDEVDGEAHGSTATQPVNHRRKGAEKNGKRKWEKAEVRAVEKHLMDFIQRQKVPQKDDCMRCLEAESEALRRRSWRGVKDYVRNRITSLQYARGNVPARPTSTRVKKRKAATSQMMKLGENNPAQTKQQYSSMQLESNKRPARRRQTQSSSHNAHPSTQQGQAVFNYGQVQGSATGTNMDVPPKSVKMNKKGAPNNNKHKWGEAEVLAVERHLMSFIRGHKVPQKNDCMRCLEAEAAALTNRSWKGVKDYVRNRITALKRQGGFSQTTSTNNNWSHQEQSQYWTGSSFY
ncbi:uncharacterized protein V6R79_024065 [Siganus canaliculatus]